MMLVSVAMAAYNGEKYIREQIDSILRQTYQNFELVICDDCSSDSTWNIIQEYEQQDKRIHCYLNETNVGFIKNFERAVGLCNGEYIALSDQDDIWLEDHIDVLLQNIGSNMICCGDAAIIDEYGNDMHCKLSGLSGDFGISFLEDSKKKLIHFIYRSNPYQGASMLLQCNAVNVLMPVPDRVSYHDAWFMFCACAKNSFVYVDKVITKYRQHRNNASGSQIRGKWSYYITAIKRTLKSTFFDKRDLSDRYYHCNALVERFSIEDKETKDIVVNARDFFAHRFNLIYRIKMLPFWIKNYRYISLSDSKKIFIMRLLKFLFFR